MAKNFHVPQSFPFDVSDKPFEIKYNDDMDNAISPGSIENNSRQFYTYTDDIDYNAHGPYLSPLTTDKIQVVTTNYIDTYYIYSFDGKLLSEYDQSGTCVRDYIYAGNRMIAEYRPATGKYYYYMSDQINSTRIITDDAGTVVYSEAYGPYGDVQKTWTKAYDPKQKFSGKEREGYSELDYFGARYFDNNSYRFISVDPIINKDEALSNPQLWNLYAYCRNNPIIYWDPNGEVEGSFNWLGIYGPDSSRPNDSSYNHFKGAASGISNITPRVDLSYSIKNNDDGTSNVRFNFSMDVMMWIEIPIWASGSRSDHIEHESGHLIQWAILYQERKAMLEKAEKISISKNGDPKNLANNVIDRVLRMNIVRLNKDHNNDVNNWAFQNRYRSVPTLGKGALRYNPNNK